MEDTRKALVDIYEEMFRQCTLNQSFVLNTYPGLETTINKFVIWYESTYTKSTRTIYHLIRYFEFQFSRYSGTYANGHGKNKIMLNWLIGVKAIDAWINRKVNEKFLVRFELRKEVGLKLSKIYASEEALKTKEKTIRTLTQTNPQEEVYKQRFYNDPKGFVYCVQTTTGYDPLSKYCRGCNFRSDCISFVKSNYPLLAKQRNLDGEDSYEE